MPPGKSRQHITRRAATLCAQGMAVYAGGAPDVATRRIRGHNRWAGPHRAGWAGGTATAKDPAITVYGASWCPDCKRARRFLGEQLVPYTWIDLGEHPEAQEIVARYNDGKQIIPTIVFEDGSVLVEPSNAALAAKLGLQTRGKCASCDVIVVRAGPTRLTAALYGAREGRDVV